MDGWMAGWLAGWLAGVAWRGVAWLVEEWMAVWIDG